MKKLLLFLTTISILVLSCKKNDTILNSEEVCLRVNASVAGNNLTRSIINGTAFPNGSSIGVELLKYEDNSAYSSKTNVKYSNDENGNWTSSESYTLSSSKAKVYGYYPYLNFNLPNDSLPFYEVPIWINSEAIHNSDYDFMYATPVESEIAAVSNANHIINLQMNHALAQISFLVYKENYNGLGKLTSFSIEDAIAGTGKILIENSHPDLKMDIRDGSITGGMEGTIKRDITTPIILEEINLDPPFPSSDVDVLKSQVLTKGCSVLIVPPGQIDVAAIKFSFTIDGNIYSVKNSSSITWEKGKQYIYKIKLSGTSLSISSVTIAEWQTVIGDDMIIQ
jgi:hypothetical protein